MIQARTFLLAAALLAAAAPAFGDGIERPQAAVVQGYPAFDAPLVIYALRHNGFKVADYARKWLPTAEYKNYSVVVVTADLKRAGVQPTAYSPEDLKNVRRFIENGGTLLITRGDLSIFAGAEGQAFLKDVMGTAPRAKSPKMALLKPDDPWVKQLAAEKDASWLTEGQPLPVPADKCDRIIGSADGYATLLRAPLGKGRIIYVGWTIAASMPSGRRPSTFEQGRNFELQAQVLMNIAAGLLPPEK